MACICFGGPKEIQVWHGLDPAGRKPDGSVIALCTVCEGKIEPLCKPTKRVLAYRAGKLPWQNNWQTVVPISNNVPLDPLEDIDIDDDVLIEIDDDPSLIPEFEFATS